MMMQRTSQLDDLHTSATAEFVGRHDAIDRIRQVEDDERESALVVVASHGGGRSRLLEHVRAQSALRAVLIRPIPHESEWPLSGFSRVLASVNDSRAVEFGGRFTLRSTEPAHMLEAAHDLLSVLRGLALDPVLLLIDDIDLMDDESQLLMSFMAGRLAGTGLRIVATASSVGPDSPLCGFQRLELEPLSVDECAELASRIAPSGSDPGTLRIVAAHAGGSPTAVVEIVRGLSERQRRGEDPLVLPFHPVSAVSGLPTGRIDGLPSLHRRMLDAISLAPLSHEAALGRRGSDEADALEDLIHSGLLRAHGHYVEIADPMLRSQIYWTMESKSRRELHATMAEAHGVADVAGRIWHESFVYDPDVDVTSRLLSAGLSYAREGDCGVAVEFAERALRTAGSVDDHLSQLIDLADAFLSHAELDLASRYALHARRESVSASRSLRLATILVSIEYAKTQTVPTDVINASISLYSAGDPEGAARLRMLAASSHSERWEVEDARDHLVRAERLMPMLSTVGRAAVIGARALTEAVEGLPPAVDDALDVIDGTVVASMSTRSMMVLGRTLSLRERYAEARHVFTIALSQPQGLDPIHLESASFFLAVNELRSGDLRRALAAAEQWHALAPRALTEKSSRLLLRGWSLYAAGRTDESHEMFGRCLERSSTERNNSIAAQLLAFQGAKALLEESRPEAVRLLELADGLGAQFHNPALLRHRVDLIEAYVATDQLREAHAVLRALHAQRAVRPSRWLTLAIGRAEGLVAPDDAPIRLFHEAVSMFGPGDSQYELGRVLTNLASVQERLGMTREGEGSLAAARSAFERAGAVSWAARSARTPDADPGMAAVEPAPENGGPAAILELLTPEERLIAEKVCEGYRNKEIAAALYVSLRTVELRLTRIYRKVGARSRSHLVAFLT